MLNRLFRKNKHLIHNKDGFCKNDSREYVSDLKFLFFSCVFLIFLVYN